MVVISAVVVIVSANKKSSYVELVTLFQNNGFPYKELCLPLDDVLFYLVKWLLMHKDNCDKCPVNIKT